MITQLHSNRDICSIYLIFTTLVTGQYGDLLPDFYAVNIHNNENVVSGYKVFSRVKNCKAYQSGDQRIIYQSGEKWIIANFNLKSGDLVCQNIGSMVNLSLPYYTTTGALPTKGSTSYRGLKITIEIEILKKCEENIGFRISDWKGTQIEPISRKHIQQFHAEIHPQ